MNIRKRTTPRTKRQTLGRNNDKTGRKAGGPSDLFCCRSEIVLRNFVRLLNCYQLFLFVCDGLLMSRSLLLSFRSFTISPERKPNESEWNEKNTLREPN